MFVIISAVTTKGIETKYVTAHIGGTKTNETTHQLKIQLKFLFLQKKIWKERKYQENTNNKMMQ